MQPRAIHRVSVTSLHNPETGALENLSSFAGFKKCEKALGGDGMCGICHHGYWVSDFWRKLGRSIEQDMGRSGSRGISGINNAKIGVSYFHDGKRSPNVFG